MTLRVALKGGPKTVEALIVETGWSLREVLVQLRIGLASGEVVEVDGPAYILDEEWQWHIGQESQP